MEPPVPNPSESVWPLPAPPAASPPRRPFRRAARLAFQTSRVGVAAFVLYALLFNISVVRGNSMAPGIHDGDRILVEPWSYLFDDVERGDVVVLRYPLDPRVDYIKRVIGLPGDEVAMRGGRVWINGEPLPEPYIGDQDPQTFQRVVVRADHYFVLGDNRRRSSDSREFGQVPANNLRGRVDLRIWPPSRLGLLD